MRKRTYGEAGADAIWARGSASSARNAHHPRGLRRARATDPGGPRSSQHSRLRRRSRSHGQTLPGSTSSRRRRSTPCAFVECEETLRALPDPSRRTHAEAMSYDEEASAGGASAAAPEPSRERPAAEEDDEGAALDACRAVIRVAAEVGPAVVSLAIHRGGGRGRGGEGSAVVIAPDGYLLTNAHVVQGAGRVKVGFTSGSTASARVVGQDPHTDLAVVRVEAEGLARPAGGASLSRWASWSSRSATRSAGPPCPRASSAPSVGDSAAETVGSWRTSCNPPPRSTRATRAARSSTRRRVVGLNTAMIPHAQGSPSQCPPRPSTGSCRSCSPREPSAADTSASRGARDPSITESRARTCDRARVRGPRSSRSRRQAPVSAAGLRDGDIVLSASGETTSSVDDLHRALSRWESAKEMTLSILRGPKESEIRVIPRLRAG